MRDHEPRYGGKIKVNINTNFDTGSTSMAGSRRTSRASGSSKMKERMLAPVPEWSTIRPDAEKIEPGFVGCSAAGCSTTSARAEYDSMLLRIGLSNCCKHVDMVEISNRTGEVITKLDGTKITVIFYDLELSKDGQVEQLSAFADTSENFCVYIRTTVRTNTSPNLRSLSPMLYNALASEPMDAMERFIEWIRVQHSMNTDGNTDMKNVVLAAHFGSCHDHVYLLRTMMTWGINPPEFRLADTLALFKVIRGMNERANLSTLVTKYASWMPHLPHDADSDARVLRTVVMTMFPQVRKACYTFSTSYADFMGRTGLNMHGVRPVYTFKDNDIYTDPDLDSVGNSDDSIG